MEILNMNYPLYIGGDGGGFQTADINTYVNMCTYSHPTNITHIHYRVC